jgi:hypothetical protein
MFQRAGFHVCEVQSGESRPINVVAASPGFARDSLLISGPRPLSRNQVVAGHDAVHHEALGLAPSWRVSQYPPRWGLVPNDPLDFPLPRREGRP